MVATVKSVPNAYSHRRLATLLAATCWVVTAAAQTSPERENLIKAARAEGSIMLYSSSGEAQSKTVLAAFEQEYGIKGNFLRLTTIPLMQRFNAEFEGNDLQADAISVSTTIPFLDHPDWWEKITPAYAPNVAKWPARWVKSNYISWSADAFYMAYNTDLVPAGTQPKTYADLLDPKWKGKILLTDPRVADNYFGWLDGLEKAKGADYLRKIATMELKLTQSGASGAQMVAAGAYAINFPTFPDFSVPLKEKKAPIATLALGNPLLVSERVVAIPVKAPHKNAARLLMDWLLSDDGVKAACKNGSVSIVADPEGKVGCPAMLDPKPVEYVLTDDRKKQLVKDFGLGN